MKNQMFDVRAMFPKASKSFLEANPLSSPQEPIKTSSTASVGTPRRGVMNKTERDFSLLLEAQKQRGEILRWEFEPFTLRFAGVRYTPDFAVWRDSPTDLCIIEVKGAFIRERGLERFRHARTYYGEYLSFQLWQKTKDGWGTPKI